MVKVKNNKKNRSKNSDSKKSVNKPLNPFEVHVNRQKHEILGRKLKHDRGLPGVARTKALKKRKATLQQEYNVKNKSNQFVDRRIGERNTAISQEDKMVARFAAERNRSTSKRKSIFNLADDEILTHKGQSLSEIEKFDNPASDEDDEEDAGKLEASFVGEAHFGGGFLRKKDDDTTTAANRQNLIQQLIAESKKRKAEKQRENEKTAALTEKLDAEWKDLQAMVLNAKSKKSKNSEDTPEPSKKLDPYDISVREMKFDARGKPTDKLKPEEEVAQEEIKRLLQLESERVQRMQGFYTEPATAPKHRSADDLDDGFSVEASVTSLHYDERGLLVAGGRDEVPADRDGEGSELGEEEHPGVSLDSDMESSGDEEEEESGSDSLDDLRYSTDEEAGDVEESTPAILNKDKILEDLKIRKDMMEKARQELPYTFQVPETYESLQELLADKNAEQVAVVLERVVKCNHPSLAPNNRERLSSLFAFLLQWLHDQARDDSDAGASTGKLVCTILPRVFDLVQLTGAGNARRCFVAVLTEKYDEWIRAGANKFPGLEMLVFFQLMPELFPASDFRHPVSTPTLVLMAHLLSACRLRGQQDVAKGLFICSIVNQCTQESKRFLPELFLFLKKLFHLVVLRLNEPAYEQYCRSKKVQGFPLDMKNCFGDDLTFHSTLEAIMSTLLKAVDIISGSVVSWRSVIDPVVELIQLVPPSALQNCPVEIQQKVEQLLLQHQTPFKLEKLVAEKSRPKPLKQFEPAIEKITEGRRKVVMSEKKRESLKLKHRYRREMKGAVREIRRDRAFIANLRLKETMRSDAERKEKVKQLMGSLASQAGEVNKFDRMKKKKK